MAPNLTIDVFSDVVCPWCYIGATRLEQALAGMADELQAEVCYHPFYLVPGVPKQGLSVPDMLRQRYGADPKQLWVRAESAARDSGLALDLSLQSMMYPTAAAHTLLRFRLPSGKAVASANYPIVRPDTVDLSGKTGHCRVVVDAK